MANYDFSNIEDLKAEEKRLHDEYKQKILELKKIQKEKEAVGQVFAKGLLPIYVLYILSMGPTNGNDISTKISERTKGLWSPSTGGIYPLLKKLEKEGAKVVRVKSMINLSEEQVQNNEDYPKMMLEFIEQIKMEAYN